MTPGENPPAPNPATPTFMDEICICAAVRTPSGLVIRGHRHSDALRTLAETGHVNCREAEQGFVTSRARFVSRREGQALQIAAGIPSVNKRGYHAFLLFSEDLY